MDLDKLVSQAKKLVDERGGMESVAGDADELKNIVGSRESLTDEAKDTAEALGTAGEHRHKAQTQASAVKLVNNGAWHRYSPVWRRRPPSRH